MAKVTQRDYFEAILTILDGELARGEDVRELMTFVCERIDALDRKANAPKVKTKGQLENDLIKTEILNALVNGQNRATEAAVYANISVQKASALLRQLVADGKVRREVEGKVTKFYFV